MIRVSTIQCAIKQHINTKLRRRMCKHSLSKNHSNYQFFKMDMLIITYNVGRQKACSITWSSGIEFSPTMMKLNFPPFCLAYVTFLDLNQNGCQQVQLHLKYTEYNFHHLNLYTLQYRQVNAIICRRQ